MNYTVISGDIISSTSLGSEDKKALEKHLALLLADLEKHFNAFGRVLKGDYIECVIPNAGEALQACLAIKSFVKTIPISQKTLEKDKHRVKLFKEHGVRLAIGYGPLERYQPNEGVIDGEAIYLSGRTINTRSTHDKERIVIKNTLFFASKNTVMNKKWTAILELLDVLFTKATQRQCEVVYLKLLGANEETISKNLGIDQSVVNRHSTNVGWNAIETAVSYFNESLTQ
ncbi:fumarate hydratase [Rasiella rasia]|uniref:Fumarate hydratase n=1 Tax=Rasiella rasia TaxID=2744027 RepID=A0A6G6GJX4_9FLAO|nr:fumarate hydratase [Rasiella rasia]QIE58852.1 fumarate hydratase [Rasiella rasia]